MIPIFPSNKDQVIVLEYNVYILFNLKPINKKVEFLMGFESENRTILDIYNRAACYLVPRYQRSYVWGEQNWSELFTDISFTLKVDEDMNWTHFLGTVVLSDSNNVVENKDSAVSYYEIIDGQQRMTTVYIIIAAIKRKFIEINTEESINRAAYIDSAYLTTLQSNNVRTLKIKNEELDLDFKEILDYCSHNEEKNIAKTNKLYKVFTYYYNELTIMNYDSLSRFLDKLININIVEIVSGEEEEIYNIFEVLNARGQKLKQMELLKNHIMKYVHPRTDQFIDDTRVRWENVINLSQQLPDIDNLMNHFVKCYIKKRAVNANSIYKLIKEEIEIDKLSQLLIDLEEFTEAYMEIHTNPSNNPAIEYFEIKRNQQIRSLLTAILIKRKTDIITEDIYNLTINNLRNFFFIFNAMQQTSNKTDKTISDLSFSIYKCTTETEFKMIMTDFFLKMSKFIERVNFINISMNNQSFRYSTKDKSLKRNNKLVKYILTEYTKNYQNDIIINKDFMTIEHLISDQGLSNSSYLGNLIIVPAQLNSEILRNKPVVEKIDILRTKSSFIVNKELDIYLDKDNNLDINARGTKIYTELYDNIFSYKPRPYNLNSEDVTTYFETVEKVKNNSELLGILKQKGKHFESYLNENPEMANQKILYESL